jgi:hypothetical protein
MVGLDDLTERLTLIRRKELEDELQKRKSQEKSEVTTFTYSRDLYTSYSPWQRRGTHTDVRASGIIILYPRD